MTPLSLRLAVGGLAAVVLVAATGADAETTGSVEATVTVSPLRIELALSRERVAVGRLLQARAVVENTSDATLEGVFATLRLDPAGVLVRKGESRAIRRLRDGTSAMMSWSICGERAGTYVVLARVTTGSLPVDSPARLLVVDPAARTCPKD